MVLIDELVFTLIFDGKLKLKNIRWDSLWSEEIIFDDLSLILIC